MRRSEIENPTYIPPMNILFYRKSFVLVAVGYLVAQGILRADLGDSNPTGAAGQFNGNVTTGCSYDPFTGNAMRTITDMSVPGAIGAYGLSLTRYWNSRLAATGEFIVPDWTWSHQWSIDSITIPLGHPPTGDYIVRFPDGRVENFNRQLSGDSGFWHAAPGTRERLQAGAQLGDPLIYLILPDGGKVEFAVSIVPDTGAGYVNYYFAATAMIDPYGIRTDFIDNTAPSAGGYFELRQPQVGRWIKIFNGGPGSRIDYIQGSDGRAVYYTYNAVPRLTDVNYYIPNSPLHAHYTYTSTGLPLLATADDPMYAGAMKKIRYHYYGVANEPNVGAPFGFIRSENHFGNQDDDALVSRLEIIDANTRRETRGDDASRTFAYSNDGLLMNWTDFNGVSFSRHYDGNKFVNSVTDGNQNPTTFTNEPHTGKVTQATLPTVDDVEIGENPITQVDYQYTDPNNPYYLQSMIDPREHSVTYIRNDPNNPNNPNRVIRINYPDQSHEEFQYDSFGHVTRHKRKNGNYEHLKYYPNGLLQFAWNPIPDETMPGDNDPTKPKTIFSYYASNDEAWPDRLKEVTDANGHVTTYEYDRFETSQPHDSRGLVTKITYPSVGGGERNYRSFEYDNYGRVRAEVNELLQRTEYTYDDYGRVTMKKTPLPPMVGEPPQATTSYDYTPAPNHSSMTRTAATVTTMTNPENIITEYHYDNNLRLDMTTQHPTTATAAVTQYHYDPAGNLEWVEDPNRHTDHNITTFLYDQQNRRKEATSPTNRYVEQFHTYWKYDAAGNVRRIIQPDGKHKVTEYDVMNRVLRDHAPIDPNIPNPPERITSYEYHPDSGMLHTVHDPNQQYAGAPYTSFTYNERDLKKTMTYPNGAIVGEWVYDNVGNLKERPTVGSSTANPAIQLFYYDERNRLAHMRWTNQVDSSDFAYDAVGRLTSAVNPYSAVTREYDVGGRLTRDGQVFPAIPGTPLPPFGPISVVSRKSHGTAGTFDIALPLVGEPAIESRSGGANGSYQIVLTFATPVSFTAASASSESGLVPTLSTNGNQSTQITVDLTRVSTAQVLSVKLAGLSDGTNTGDLTIPVKFLIGDTNGDGVVNTGDVVQTQSHAGQQVDATNFRFDVNADGIINVGDRTLVRNNSGQNVPIAPPAGQVSYQYYKDGRVKQLYLPNNDYNFNYNYDGMGRLEWITQNSNPNARHQYQYDAASNVTARLNYANNTSLNFVPDELNRIADETINVQQAAGISDQYESYQFSHLQYRYDGMNRLVSTYRTEAPGVQDIFGYNEAGELTSAQYGTNNSYTYNLDLAGNRTQVLRFGYVPFNYTANSLNQYDPTANNNGITNGTQHEISSYPQNSIYYYYLNDTYLSRVTGGSDTYDLGYDALGRCVRRKFNNQVKFFVHDGPRAILEYTATGSFTANTLYGLGVDEIIARNNNGQGQYPLQDRLGNTVALTGGDGVILEQYRYDAFGAPTFLNGDGTPRQPNDNVTHFNNRFLFTGREWMPRFGFYEYRARAYNPELGRFMSEDPLGFAAGDSNLFRYCGGDPVNRSDPSGMVDPEAIYQNEARDSNDYGNSNSASFSTQGWWSNPDGTPTGVGGSGPDTGNQGGGRSTGGGGGGSYTYYTQTPTGGLQANVLGWNGAPPSVFPGNDFGFRPGEISRSVQRVDSWAPFYRFLNTPATQQQAAWTDTGRAPTLVVTGILALPLLAPEGGAAMAGYALAGWNGLVSGVETGILTTGGLVYVAGQAVLANPQYIVSAQQFARGFTPAMGGSSVWPWGFAGWASRQYIESKTH